MRKHVITETKEELMNCLKRNDDGLDKTTKTRRQFMNGSNMRAFQLILGRASAGHTFNKPLGALG
jgi:hypothetical protein